MSDTTPSRDGMWWKRVMCVLLGVTPLIYDLGYFSFELSVVFLLTIIAIEVVADG